MHTNVRRSGIWIIRLSQAENAIGRGDGQSPCRRPARDTRLYRSLKGTCVAVRPVLITSYNPTSRNSFLSEKSQTSIPRTAPLLLPGTSAAIMQIGSGTSTPHRRAAQLGYRRETSESTFSFSFRQEIELKKPRNELAVPILSMIPSCLLCYERVQSTRILLPTNATNRRAQISGRLVGKSRPQLSGGWEWGAHRTIIYCHSGSRCSWLGLAFLVQSC